MRGHLFVHVVEHRGRVVNVTGEERAIALRSLLSRDHFLFDLLLRASVLLVRPGSDPDEVFLQSRYRIAERKACPVICRTVLRGIVSGGMGARAVGDPFDQRGAETAMCTLGSPARDRQPREEVVTVGTQRYDPIAQAARSEGGHFASGDALERGDRPLV